MRSPLPEVSRLQDEGALFAALGSVEAVYTASGLSGELSIGTKSLL